MMWPELLGARGEEARSRIEKENPYVDAAIVREGRVVTLDLRCDRRIEETMRGGDKKSGLKFAVMAVLLLLIAIEEAGVATVTARPIRDSSGEALRPQYRAPVPPSGRNPCSHFSLPSDGRHCL
ncbi:hypothetical protein SDJN03_26674, partial [Cucurbita argyrosperma subsp. sororia]